MHLKVSAIFTQSILLHMWIKPSLSFLAVKFEAHGSFLLGENGIFVATCIFKCVGQQLTYKLGDLFMFRLAKTKLLTIIHVIKMQKITEIT